MGDWLTTLGDSIDSIGQDILDFLIWLVGALISAFQFLYNLLAAVFNFFYALAQTIGRFFLTLWNDFFKGVFTALWHAIVKVHDWLESILQPVVKFLQTIRKWVDWYFQTYVKPFLNLLIKVRQFLSILRSFGIKWAAQLDRIVGQIQADVAGVMLKVQGTLNALIDVVSILADPLNLQRRPTAVLSIRRIVPTLVRVTTGLPIGFFFPSPRKGAPLGIGQLPLNFDPGNPAMNPPASSYFTGDDGLGAFSGFTAGDVPQDSAVDDLTILEYFDDGLYDPPTCSDAVHCLTVLQAQAYAAITKPVAA